MTTLSIFSWVRNKIEGGEKTLPWGLIQLIGRIGKANAAKMR
jgi:hypothetical protein